MSAAKLTLRSRCQLQPEREANVHSQVVALVVKEGVLVRLCYFLCTLSLLFLGQLEGLLQIAFFGSESAPSGL